MELEIRPEPKEGDEAALEAAVGELKEGGSAGGRGAWWQEGTRENLEAPDD